MSRDVPKTVLVVDNIGADRQFICEIIKRGLGISCAQVGSGADALAYLKRDEGALVDLVLLDLFMPGLDGMEVLQTIRTLRPSMPIVILTASKNVDHAVRAIQSGAMNYLVKPTQEDRLITSVKNAIDTGKMYKEIDRLRDRVGDVVEGSGESGILVSLCEGNGAVKPMVDLEVEIAAKVLAHCGGNVSKAAKALGLARSTFYRKLSCPADKG